MTLSLWFIKALLKPCGGLGFPVRVNLETLSWATEGPWVSASHVTVTQLPHHLSPQGILPIPGIYCCCSASGSLWLVIA